METGSGHPISRNTGLFSAYSYFSKSLVASEPVSVAFWNEGGHRREDYGLRCLEQEQVNTLGVFTWEGGVSQSSRERA